MPASPTTNARSSSKPSQYQPEGKVKILLTISTSLFDLLEEQAISHGRDVEEEMVDRLRRFLPLKDAALVFDSSQKAELERALGHTCKTPDVAISMLKGVLSLKVGDINIPLESKLQGRIASRAKSMRRTTEETLRREVIESLERFCGMRPY